MHEINGNEIHALAALVRRSYEPVVIYGPDDEIPPKSSARHRWRISPSGEITFIDLAPKYLGACRKDLIQER